ncbi:hypothetical protein SGRA_0826 [Saprospira grandis str. Lewin]|uniref:Uncharacterized protein n=1 Tax=Saprospira grandis (strain Lewin) TaxID=984262 RepID=H6L226_SAPGL|nr:hypothetical protein SGRA_0826 [Saprospira grandis str. Lewin]
MGDTSARQKKGGSCLGVLGQNSGLGTKKAPRTGLSAYYEYNQS